MTKSNKDAILIQYHYCDLDPEKKGCLPGSQPECKWVKSNVNCQYLKYRKEGENVDNT